MWPQVESEVAEDRGAHINIWYPTYKKQPMGRINITELACNLKKKHSLKTFLFL